MSRNLDVSNIIFQDPEIEERKGKGKCELNKHIRKGVKEDGAIQRVRRKKVLKRGKIWANGKKRKKKEKLTKNIEYLYDREIIVSTQRYSDEAV